MGPQPSLSLESQDLTVPECSWRYGLFTRSLVVRSYSFALFRIKCRSLLTMVSGVSDPFAGQKIPSGKELAFGKVLEVVLPFSTSDSPFLSLAISYIFPLPLSSVFVENF